MTVEAASGAECRTAPFANVLSAALHVYGRDGARCGELVDGGEGPESGARAVVKCLSEGLTTGARRAGAHCRGSSVSPAARVASKGGSEMGCGCDALAAASAQSRGGDVRPPWRDC